jgi:hypothetical protein
MREFTNTDRSQRTGDFHESARVPWDSVSGQEATSVRMPRPELRHLQHHLKETWFSVSYKVVRLNLLSRNSSPSYIVYTDLSLVVLDAPKLKLLRAKIALLQALKRAHTG